MKKHSIHFHDAADCVEVFHQRDNQMQKIGEIFGGTTLVTKRTPAKHLLRRLNAYGFNSELMNSGRFESIVVIQQPGPQLLISTEDAKINAHVEVTDEEEQYFIPLDYFIVL